jgi:TRAP-type C4-dicarboxylate transport system permease large subunit
MVAIYVGARLRGLRASHRPSSRVLLGDLRGALIPLGLPLIIFGGIFGGFAIPVEAASVAATYGVLASFVVYRVSFRSMSQAAIEAARFSGMLTFLLGAAGLFVWVLVTGGLANRVVAVTGLFAGQPILFMLACIAALVVAGMVFEGLPALILLAPVLFPVAIKMGINEFQFGLLLIVGMGLGSFAPPFGVNYFAVCALADADPGKAAATTWLYMGIVLLGLIFVALFPPLTTLIPSTFMNR